MDSICVGGSTNLLLVNYVGAIQWQSYNGSLWVDETGPGALTDNYLVSPVTSTDYRAVVTAVGCDPDTSVILNITVGVTAPSTSGATRCGYGPVTVSATGSGIRWYDAATGGNLLGTGSSYTTNVAATTSFYASASSNGGGSGTAGMPAQNTTFSGNARGYFFTAPSDFTITGLFVPTTASSGNQNIAVVRFDNQTPPPVYATTTNAFTVLFLTQNDPATGVIPVNLQIAAGDVIGVLATRGADVNSYATGPATTTIDGQTVTISRMGMQFPLASTPPQDLWQEVGGNISRLEITYEVGCESSRTAAVATVNAATPATVAANPPALCQGQSSTLTVSSTNAGYTYTWSPATGLSGTTGTTVTATPLTPITYTVVADDGVCGYIDSVFISVGPASVAGTAVISTDTICLGDNATLFLSGNTGNIQWQSNNGGGWVNETGPGSTSSQYQVSPVLNSDYRAVITSGGCDPDTTVVLPIVVLAITDPLTVNDSICGPGTVNLAASGNGVLSWYTSATGGSVINTGTAYSPTVSSSTTYYVEAAAGGTYAMGIPALLPTAQLSLPGNDWGIQFDVISQSTIQSVNVYPALVSGNITINLRDAQGGPILNTVTVPVAASSGPVTVNLGFTVNPGTGYRLELATGSVPCLYNTFGAAYPYTVANSPITLTGQINPAFSTGTYYYFFYGWVVTEGCRSNRIPVEAVVFNLPAVPTISPAWNTLTSSSPTGNQWYVNGVAIPGATGQTHIASQAGTYTVVVTDANGCSSVSQGVFTTGIEEMMASYGAAVYPNPVKDLLTIEVASSITGEFNYRIYNVVGELALTGKITDQKQQVDLSDLPPGVYSMELNLGSGVYRTKIVRQ